MGLGAGLVGISWLVVVLSGSEKTRISGHASPPDPIIRQKDPNQQRISMLCREMLIWAAFNWLGDAHAHCD
jgi:hypothetical protein